MVILTGTQTNKQTKTGHSLLIPVLDHSQYSDKAKTIGLLNKNKGLLH